MTEIQNKHREWLKEYERQRYLKGIRDGNTNKTWETDYRDEKYDPSINLIGISPKKIFIEFDEESRDKQNKGKKSSKEQREKWVDQTIAKIEKDELGYELHDHQGKCRHIVLSSDTDLTKEQKEAIIKYYVPSESFEFADLSLCGIHLVAVPFVEHWKYGTMKEMAKSQQGLFIDVNKIKEKDFIVQKSSGITAEIVSKIKLSDLALEYGAQKGKGTPNYHCCFHDDKTPSLSLDDKRGFFKCFGCGKEGNIVDFVSEAENISREEAVNKLIERAGISNFALTDDPDTRVKIKLPKSGKLVSIFAQEVADVLKDKNLLFFRADSREVVEIGKIKNEKEQKYTGFLPVRPSRFITLAEKFIIPGNLSAVKKDEEIILEFQPKSMTSDLANISLQSYIFEETLLNINRIFTVPLPIIYNGKLTFPKTGYDIRFKSWLPYNSPKIINPEMSLEEAKEIIYEILKEFVFKSNQDYINAIAGLITPFLRGLYSRFNCRTPVFFYTANRERAGKDYLAGITGLIYEGTALEEPPICNSEMKWTSDDELRKKILSAFIAGRKRLHFANNKGYLDNAVFEAIITSEKYSDRILGRNESPIFDNELEFSLSGNVGIGVTPDLANRSRFVRLFLEIEDANARKFERPNLHRWVLDNRELILSAIYALVRNWIEKGRLDGSINFASFPEWAKICGGIMEAAGYESPCFPDRESITLGGDSETMDMKSLFELCYERKPDTPMTKWEIKQIIEAEDIFSYLDFTKRSDQTKFGNKVNKFVGRVLSDIKMLVKDSSVRSSRQEYIFTKEKADPDKSKIFGNFHKNGNLGNLHNLLPIDKEKSDDFTNGHSNTLPTLRRLPNTEDSDSQNDKSEEEKGVLNGKD